MDLMPHVNANQVVQPEFGPDSLYYSSQFQSQDTASARNPLLNYGVAVKKLDIKSQLEPKVQTIEKFRILQLKFERMHGDLTDYLDDPGTIHAIRLTCDENLQRFITDANERYENILGIIENSFISEIDILYKFIIYLDLLDALLTPLDEWIGLINSKIRAARSQRRLNRPASLTIEPDQLELIHDLGGKVANVITMLNSVPDEQHNLMLAVIEAI